MNSKLIFDKISSEWQNNYLTKKSFIDRDLKFQKIIEEILRRHSITSVLELGCGSYSAFRKPGYMYYATDLSLEMLKNNNIKKNLFQSDINFLPLKSTFDLIILSSVLEWLYRPHNIINILNTVSINGSLIIISYPNPFSAYRLLEKLYAKTLSLANKKHYTHSQSKFNFHEVQYLFKEANYKQVRKFYTGKKLLLHGKLSSSLIVDIYERQ